MTSTAQDLTRRDLAIVDDADPRFQHFLMLSSSFRRRASRDLTADELEHLWAAAERSRQIDERLSLSRAQSRTQGNFGVGPSVVYYAKLDNLVKIGTSTNILGRMETLGLGIRSIAGLEPGSFAEERERHQRFARLRVRGEWFRLKAELRSHISSLPGGWKSARDSLVLVSVEVSAANLGVHRATVYRWIENGKVSRYGSKVDQVEVEEYAASLRDEPL